jgi:prepilin peptidase CpaA
MVTSLTVGVPLTLLAAASAYDLRSREIPDAFPALLLAWAVGTTALQPSANGWTGLGLGLFVGLALGLLLFRFGAFGGGDAKLVAALGALLGPREIFVLLFYVALAGAVLAIVAALRGARDFAYGPAIAVGFLVMAVARGLW